MLPVPRRWEALTPAWMNDALAARIPGVAVEAIEIDRVRHGTNSRARVSVRYARGSGPASVFVKLAGRRLHRFALLALRALATEARLAAGLVAFPLDHPSFYAGGIDWSRLGAVVVMEDVAASGGRPNVATAPLSVDEVRSGLAGLAKLHGAYWDRTLAAPLDFMRPWRLGRSWSMLSAASLAQALHRLERLGAPLAPERYLSAVSLAHQFRNSALLASSGVQTLLHGDPHPGNTYSRNAAGTGFYDWQLARVGHWSHDVGYFLVGSLDVSERRAHEEDLLAGYLDQLGRAGADAPQWQAARARYRACPAFGLATWLHTLSFGSLQPTDVCLATIARFAAAYEDLDTRHSAVMAA
jgi:hypothetical protein